MRSGHSDTRTRVEALRAPAKVNLSLRILGRRPDGYHLLRSVMAPISLYDDLHIRFDPEPGPTDDTITVTSNSVHAPGGSTNLAFRAADLLLKALKMPTGRVYIEIRKRIPVGSGLGGGSSDAAAVLLALNRLLGSPYTPADLVRLGAQLGADIPFFVYGCPARVSGVGEHIEPIESFDPLSLVVCSDGYNLSTKAVYAHVDLALTTGASASNIASFVDGREFVSALLVNDLEAAATKIHPGVLSLKARLAEQGALGTLMTGSGSAVFGVWPDIEAARRAAARLREQGLWAEAAETLSVSPAVVR